MNPTTPPVDHVPDTPTPSPTNINPTLVYDFHGVKWYNSKDVIDLYEVPSLQWNFINHFGDPVYLEIYLARRGLWK